MRLLLDSLRTRQVRTAGSAAVVSLVVFAVLIVLLLLLLALGQGFQKIPLNRVGVIIDNFGGGVQEQDLLPGYVWVWPIGQNLLIFDPTVQEILLEKTSRQVDRRVEIRAKDQYVTYLDVTILYRLARDAEGRTMAWKLAKALQTQQRAVEVARANADKFMKERLSGLITEDFYNVEQRLTATREALTKLNAEMEQEGLVFLDILVRKIDYHESFEKRLLEKQLIEQEQLLQKSMERVQKEQLNTEKIAKETEAMIKKITQEQGKEVKRIESEKEKRLQEIEGDTNFTTKSLIAEAQLHAAKKTADGQLLVERSRAKGEEAINRAYQKFGGDYLLAKRMLEGIEIGQIEINTNLWNPFDVRQTLEKILGRKLEHAGQESSGTQREGY